MTRDRERHQALAEELGAAWITGGARRPSFAARRGHIFAPARDLIPAALPRLDSNFRPQRNSRATRRSCTSSSSGERRLQSVANNTCGAGRAFRAEAARIPVTTHIRTLRPRGVLDVDRLKTDAIRGAGVLIVA
jgi:hypothetical protein